MVADFVMAWNGTAGNGVFQPAQKAVNVFDLDFGFGNVANLDIARAFHTPDNHPALGFAEARNGFGQIFTVVTMQCGKVFADRNSLFEIKKQLLGLGVYNKIINGIFTEIYQLLKDIFRS